MALLVDLNGVLEIAWATVLCLASEVEDQQGVGSSFESVVWLAHGANVVDASTEVDAIEDLVIRVLSSLVEERVDRVFNFGSGTAIFHESVALGFNREVDHLLFGNGDLEVLVLRFLNDVVHVLLFLCEVLPNGDSCDVEVWSFEVKAEGHKEDAIVGFVVSYLLQELRSPSFVAVRPFTRVSLFGPWISDFGELGSFDRDDVEKSVEMVVYQAIRCSALRLAAANSHIMLFNSQSMNCIIELLFVLDPIVPPVKNWLVCEVSETLAAQPTDNSVIVSYELSIGFLENWHPPCAVI